MRTTAVGVLLVLGSIGALAANGVAGCTYTAAGQGSDAAPPSIENGGDGGYYTGGEDGGVTPQGNDASVSTNRCGANNCSGVCCESTCCPTGTNGCNGNECGGTVTCGPNAAPCGSNGCCPVGVDASPTCGAEQTYCPSHGCTDLQTDQNNCGNCSIECASGQTCTSGLCTASGATCMPPQTFATDCPQYVADENDTAAACQSCLSTSGQNCLQKGGANCSGDFSSCQQKCTTPGAGAGAICMCVANCLGSSGTSSGMCCAQADVVLSCIDSACASACGPRADAGAP
jgi:hypothetical protein